MNRRTFLRGAAAAPAATTVLRPAAIAATDSPGRALPKPRRQGGKPLMQTLNERKTLRTLTTASLSEQQLSDLLWAAFGVSRPDGRRTAPTAMNAQDIRVYAFLPDAVYLYDAARHALVPVASGDQRAKTGGQAEAARAAVTLVYVTDYEKYGARAKGDPSSLMALSNVHAGFIGQNVYLYAASEGLGAWFRGSIDKDAIASVLKLGPAQKVLYAHTVGIPAAS